MISVELSSSSSIFVSCIIITRRCSLNSERHTIVQLKVLVRYIQFMYKTTQTYCRYDIRMKSINFDSIFDDQICHFGKFDFFGGNVQLQLPLNKLFSQQFFFFSGGIFHLVMSTRWKSYKLLLLWANEWSERLVAIRTNFVSVFP